MRVNFIDIMTLKLAYVLPTLSHGGAEIRAIERLNFLAKNYDVIIDLIILSNELQLIDNVESYNNFNLHILNLPHSSVFSKKALIHSINNAKKLKSTLRKISPNVIVASLPISHHLTRLALFNIKDKDLKVLMYHHATQYIENPINSFSKKILHQLTRFLNKKIDSGHIFISEAVKEDISKNLVIKSSYVLHNAVPDKFDSINDDLKLLNEKKIQHYNAWKINPSQRSISSVTIVDSVII